MKEAVIEAIKGLMNALDDDARLEVLFGYCSHCGCKQPEDSVAMRCQCWNDE